MNTEENPVPAPQNCSNCHDGVPGAAERVRAALAEVAQGRTAILSPEDVRTVLEALEAHHAG